MNDLDRQLAELALINQIDLQPSSLNTGKKIGPAVPPKPKKNQPQVRVFVIKIFCSRSFERTFSK